MDIWEELYTKAKEQYHPGGINPFIYAHHVVCALESENGVRTERFTQDSVLKAAAVSLICVQREQLL